MVKWKNYYNYILIILISFAIYGKAISFKFNLDDELVTKGNSRVEKGFSGIGEIINGYYYEDNMGYKYGYRPVSQISFAIEYQLFKENPHVSHFINIVIYILICCFIFYFLQNYSGIKFKYFPIVVTLMFLVHPLHVEAVASIKNREELFAFLFPLIALITCIKAIDTKKWYLFIIVVLCNFLAIYSKQSAVAFLLAIPFLILFSRKINKLQSFIISLLFFPFIVLVYNGNDNYVSLLVYSFVAILFFQIITFTYQNLNQIFNWGKINLEKVNKLVLFILLFIAFFFLLFKQEFEFIFVISILLYENDIIKFRDVNFKVEWIYISFYIILSLISFYIFKEFDYIYIMFFIYVGLQFLPKKFNCVLKIFLVILTSFIVYDTISDKFYIENYVLIITFFGLLLMKLNITNIIKLTKSLILFVVGLLMITFYIHSPNDISFSKVDNNDLFIEDFKHKNITFSDRVLDLTESPFLYFKSNVAKNGLYLSSINFYLRKIFIPYPIASYYGYNVIQPILNPKIQFLLLLLFLSVLSILVFFVRKVPFLLWSLILLIISLISISNYFKLIPGIVADRLSFTLILPFVVLIVYFIFILFKNYYKYSLILFTIIILLFTSLSFSRVSYWENPIKLFSKDVENFPNSAKLNSLLATNIMAHQSSRSNGFNLNQVSLAKLHLEKSIDIYPDFFNSYYDLARVNEVLNNTNEAILNYEYVVAKDSSFYDVYLALTDLYLQQNNLLKAEFNLQKYLNYAGVNLDLYFELSSINYQLGNYRKVISLNNIIIQNNPQIPEAYLNIAYAYGMLSNKEKLIQYLDLGEKLAPHHKDIQLIKNTFL